MEKDFQSYGVTLQREVKDPVELNLEELKIKGFTVLENILTAEEIKTASQKLDDVYQQQENNFGKSELEKINELDLARCPLAYDDFFLHHIAANKKLMAVIEKVLGDFFVLHLQNGIINRPSKVHHQSSWHRDLPYQNFVISKPIAIGALFCIDDFTIENGCTHVVPFTHQQEFIPSLNYIEKHEVAAEAKAGSVILFDAMLFHKAGFNQSPNTRRGINNVYVAPILSQQINLPKLLNGKYSDDAFLSRLLGYQSTPAEGDIAYRNRRIEKLKP